MLVTSMYARLADSFPVYVTDVWNTSNVFEVGVDLTFRPDFSCCGCFTTLGQSPFRVDNMAVVGIFVLRALQLKTPDWTAKSLPADGGFAMLQENQPPSQVNKPHLNIPHCNDGVALATNFKNDRTLPPSNPANQSTRVEVCWDSQGLRFHTNATDVNIFSTATKCNDPTFSDGDVLEVFVAPVEQLTDVPSWYLELDTGASGALWGMLAHNPLSRFHGLNRGGNVDNMGCEHV